MQGKLKIYILTNNKKWFAMCLHKAKGMQMTKPHLYISRAHCLCICWKTCIERRRVARQHMASPYCCHSLRRGSARSLLAGSGFAAALWSAVVQWLDCSILCCNVYGHVQKAAWRMVLISEAIVLTLHNSGACIAIRVKFQLWWWYTLT